ncbi:2-desacetyl-2-hydroxyethyl bacteriochlorophyllide A dehydrogenase [Evansella caseinilytica]|uniref:2-desacetyl-2-hydroxyethyl bacteriochlorophyllide A dehydrogenase n=1 Tax=Evansella caseinilytica TaxID=1503961 RepID=A0A1H3G7U7_9BACI|nr:alcohol dehydrogenase catalytic domain-containing protein [Evansella caseinilytica]SDX99125.1 2-desacetyl-2-hydroxyethyl bacteriochlorophyllide A dehydrogenase [Evansella caseinilytica]
MKAGIYQGTRQLEVAEVAVPSIAMDEALIKMSYAGICGTDMMIYSGLHPRASAPLIMGHEFSGVIEKINTTETLTVGDRVAVNPLTSCGKCVPCKTGLHHICDNLRYLGIDLDGGFARYVKVPVGNLYKLPDSISDMNASLIEPLAVAIHTVRRSKLKVADTAVILGAGPIGLLIGLIAKRAGAAKVMISDVSRFRLKIAEAYELEPVDATKEDIVKVVKESTNGVGADVVFEVAGNQMTANQMIEAIRTQGEIVVVSVYKKSPEINLAKMHFRELSLTTTRCFTSEDFQKALSMLSQGEIDLSGLVSHKLPLDQFEEGFKLMVASTDSMKILFYS